MQNNYQMGRLITLILYFLEGLMTVLVNVFQKKEQLSITLLITGVWIISFWLLLCMNHERRVSKRVYYLAEAFFSGLMACALAYATENMYFMLFVFWAQWMAYMLFLDKLATRIALVMHSFFMYVVTYAFRSGFYFRVHWNAPWVQVIALICVWWLTEILINFLNSQNRLNREQEMSLDDMLRLVEAMCDEAKLATKSKSAFLSNMSHEIRTPINAVLGMNEMILRECEDEKILSYAVNIRSAGKTLLFLINDILDMTKIESGRMDIVPTEYDVTDVIIDLWNIIYLRAKEKGLKVTFVLDETMPRKLFGDDVRITQIATNLLTNAVKYTPIGNIELHATYKKTGEDSMDLIISVKDTGIGIRQEDMGKLFESFQRLDEEKNRHIEGTGLGMNITKSLLSLMKGDIEVESEYQKGSTFTVTIPQKILSSEPTGDFEHVLGGHKSGAEKRPESFEAPEAKVLVVDDKHLNLEVFEALLKRTKVNVVTADSGRKCLELVKKEPFHIIFMDHLMPEMDGVETLREIKKLKDFPNEKTPVIVLTANAVSGAKEFYLKEGFADFLAKPIDTHLLEQMIASYLPKELIQIQKKGQAATSRIDAQETGAGSASQKTVLGSAAQETISGSATEKDRLVRLEEKGFHTEKGIQYCSDDRELYEEVLLAFAQEAEGEITAIETSHREEDLKNYQIHVHGLKSASRTLGADTLSEMARKAEEAAKNQDIAYIKENQQELIEKYRETVQNILEVLA